MLGRKQDKKMGHDHKKKDLNGFLMELLQSVEVGYHTIFIIPTTMMEGIWLVPDSHKSNREGTEKPTARPFQVLCKFKKLI